MTDVGTDELLELADRCEQAPGPRLVLDDEIAKFMLQASGRVWIGLSKPYTASLDAAMTLVPEGWAYGFDYWPTPDEHARADNRRARVWLKQCSEVRVGRQIVWGHSDDDLMVECRAETPALALCAAALRARATKEQP